MTRFFGFVLLTAVTALGTELSSPSGASTSQQTQGVTFNKDVLPILQRNCQVCHRTGEVAPMSFLTYESTRPWAKAIKSAVLNKQMPPWFADPHYGEFRNEPKLTQEDIRTLAAWADTGAREGDPSARPPAVQWREGWRIQPDVVVSIPEGHYVPARGIGEIKEFVVPNPFKEDTWVTSIEVRPGDPSVVHHVIVRIPEQASGTMFSRKAVNCGNCPQPLVQKAVLTSADARIDERVPQSPQGGGGGGGYGDFQARIQERITGEGSFTTMEAVYAPGTSPLDFRFHNSAKLIRGGNPIRIEVHYTPNGKETTDRTMVGFTLASAPAERRFVIMAPEHMADERKAIPAGESNWETRGELTFKQDADLVWFMPHMHLRGKDMTFRLVYPNGREETVLNAKFNFNWQLGYELENPVRVTRGTRMIVTAHHDNSANNSSNPTPDQPAAWGEMTSQEMMLPWFGVVVDNDALPKEIASYRPTGLSGPRPASMSPAVRAKVTRISTPIPAVKGPLPGRLPELPIAVPFGK
jgi:hypothetical protein